MSFSGLFFFTHHSLCSSARRVLTQQSLNTVFFFFFLFDEVSRGLSYSSQGVKCVKWREWVCAFVCFSESCTGWPVPDDQEPRRLSKCPRCAGDRVQKRFVGSPHVSPVDPSISLHLLPVFAVLCKSFKPPIVSFCFYSVSFLKVFSNRSPGFFFFKALSKFFFDCFFTHFQLRPCICPFSEHRFLLSQWSVSHSSLKKTPVLSTITDSLAKKLF